MKKSSKTSVLETASAVDGAAFSDSDSTSKATRSDMSIRRVATPAAIAGVTRSDVWILQKL